MNRWPHKERTAYDDGSEEIGRKQLDWEVLGGAPEMLNDGDDYDYDPNEVATEADFREWEYQKGANRRLSLDEVKRIHKRNY